MKKIAIIFGGKSVEHEISLRTMKNIVEALPEQQFVTVLIGIDKNGDWYHFSSQEVKAYFKKTEGRFESLFSELTPISNGISNLIETIKSCDVAFPAVHGPLLEDGNLQGFLRILDIPFVGSGVLGSAIGMDKAISKILARSMGIATANFMVLSRSDEINPIEIANKLSLPLFVKPLSLGSSVGIQKVYSPDQLLKAINEAFQYEGKVILEGYIRGLEVECALFGNESVSATLPCAIKPRHEFYSYEAKYIDPDGMEYDIPAKIHPSILRKVQEISITLYKLFSCEGLARMDFFITQEGAVVFNEVNTLPGFTTISMYPKMWEASGVSYPELLERLIQLALDRSEKQQGYKTTVEIETVNSL